MATRSLQPLPDDTGARRRPRTGATQPHGRTGLDSPKEAMRTPALWILAAGVGTLFLVQAGINTHLAALLRDEGLERGGFRAWA